MAETTRFEFEVPRNIREVLAQEATEGMPETHGIMPAWHRLQAEVILIVGTAQCSCEIALEDLINLIRAEWAYERMVQDGANRGANLDGYDTPRDRIVRLLGCDCLWGR
jgi:hypothetical protein